MAFQVSTSFMSVTSKWTRRPKSVGQPYRLLSTTSAFRSKKVVTDKKIEDANQSPISWHHHGWSESVLQGIVPAHRKPRTAGDRIAWRLVRLCRYGMDLATGMKGGQRETHKHSSKPIAHRPLTEDQWLKRFIFLESIAGVPGMVASTLRGLHSIRRLKRDNGWTTTLIEESYNERMHLLAFVTMYKPGWFMKLMILGAQGVFFNTMFVSYLISPKICHRFVGYLEEEAVWTYTHCLRDIDGGLLPRWRSPDFRIPDIAVQYWNMPEGRRTMRDLVLYIRADEAAHRGVNHTLGNLDQQDDANPFVGAGADDDRKPLAALRPMGFERGEVVQEITSETSVKV